MKQHQLPEQDTSRATLRSMALRILGVSAISILMMVVVLLLGWFAGGLYWITSVALCILVYVMLGARAAMFRHRLARWRSRNATGS